MVANIIPTAPGIILLIAWWATLVILERRGQSLVTTERRRAEGPYSWPKAVVSGTVGFVT